MMAFEVFLALLFVLSVLAHDPFTSDADSNGHTLPVYSPARPPAVPLAVRGPYTSAWQSTAGSGTLNSVSAEFWPGNPLGWEGIVQVDGLSYEYLGIGSQSLPTLPNLKSATPLTVSYDSQYSNYTFSAGPVEIVASFFSPVLPTDYCRTSIPLSYLTTSATSQDGADHDVRFYGDVNAAWLAFDSDATVQWDLVPISGNGSTLYTWLFNLATQYIFAENNQFPEWGNFEYTTSPGSAQNATYQSGYSVDLRYNWVMQGALSNTVDPNYRGSGEQEPVFAFSHDFGSVPNATALYTIGSVQQPIMRYLTSDGLVSLQPWWTSCYGDMFSMIQYHYDDFDTIAALASVWESQLEADVDAFYASEGSGSSNNTKVYSSSTASAPYPYPHDSVSTDQFGQQYVLDPDSGYGFLNPTTFATIAMPDVSEAESYYSLVALVARQIMGAYVLAVPPALGCSNDTNTSEPLMFQKEISSDGNVNTVDVMYPAMPFFLYANPDLLRFNLNPLYYNEEQGFYPNGYSMHDLGATFPNATGHVEGDDEYMPVEESGNMILMTYGYYKFSGDIVYLQEHYTKLAQWAGYLIDFSLIPGEQLSTDDFAGQLVNQTNLAIKGIVALAAMADIALLTNHTSDSTLYAATAQSYYTQWATLAIDPSGNHTTLAYSWRSSWGLLYNVFPAKLFNLTIIPQSLYDMQSAWYPTVSQDFGIPLDSRHSYTKSDWSMWVAATCASGTRRLFVDMAAGWVNSTSTGGPCADLYDTVGGGYAVGDGGESMEFVARPVVGGLFALLAMGKAGGSGGGNGTK